MEALDAIEGLDDGAYSHFGHQVGQYPGIIAFMQPAYYYSSYVGVAVLFAIVMLLFLVQGKRRAAVVAFVSFASAVALAQVLHMVIPRPSAQRRQMARPRPIDRQLSVSICVSVHAVPDPARLGAVGSHGSSDARRLRADRGRIGRLGLHERILPRAALRHRRHRRPRGGGAGGLDREPIYRREFRASHGVYPGGTESRAATCATGINPVARRNLAGICLCLAAMMLKLLP